MRKVKEKLQNKSYFKIIIFIVVLCIPIIYSFFYLKSYWDPYGKLTDMDVAIVNLDKGNGDENKGEELVNTLIEKDVIKLTKVSEDEANEGLSKQKYYATITIPSNFTESLNSAKEEEKQIATITYRPNQKYNYLASQIINKVVTAAQTEVQNEVSKQVVTTLSDNLREVPDSLEKISDGANEIFNGSTDLKVGLKELRDGTATLDEKYAMFDDGVKSALEGSKQLETGTKQVNAGTKSLSKGGKKLEEALDQIDQGSSTLLASGTQGVEKLTDGVNSLDDGATKVKSGVDSYVDGTNELVAGITDYVAGTEKLENNVDNYIGSVNSLLATLKKYEGVDPTIKAILNTKTESGYTVEKGLTALGTGITSGFNGLTANDTRLKAGAKQLKDNSKDLKNGMAELKAGTKQLRNSTSSLSQLTEGMKSLQDGIKQVEAGDKTLNEGINTLDNGTDSLVEGSKALKTGLATLSNNSTAVKDALSQLKAGSETAYDGSKQLARGTATFKTEIEKGLEDTKAELTKLDNLDTHVENSVEVEEEPYGEVSSYGIAFTPLFLCIGLWVGALMCYVVLYYDQEKRFGILVRGNENRILQNIAYLGISVAMGLLTGFLLKVGLGFEVVSTGIYYLECILIAVTFMSIIQCLIKNLGDVGKFLGLIILVLQLASSGGTFPIPLIDKGFQSISSLLPMTYSIKIVKDCLIGTDTSFLLQNSMILIGITIGCLVITAIVDIVKIKKAEKK